MRETLRVWAIVTFMILATTMQLNLTADADASKYLKEDMDLAVHDAGLKIEPDQLAKGKIVFDPNQAYQAFVQSLEKNADLKMANPGSKTLKPASGSFFQDSFKVKSFIILDDSNASFPYTYSYPSHHLDLLLEGPSIIAVVETYGPRYFSGQKNVVIRTASYTYKIH